MKGTVILTLLFTVLLTAGAVRAQEIIREDESLNYTYLGPLLSFAYNKVEYTDWVDTSTKKVEMSGYIYSGGLALEIFADAMCGDFQMKYAYNQLDSAMTYMDLSLSGKYLYSFNSTVSLGAGLGVYTDIPFSTADDEGSAGIQLPVTLVINTSPGTLLFVDIFTRYGSFGVGRNASSIAAGINAGFVFKVGRI